jgi:hypothetical protein
MGMLHPSEFSLTRPCSISTQSVTTGNGTLNTTYIARTLLFTVHNSNHFTDVQKKTETTFFSHEGEEINLLFWGNMFKLH